MPIWTNLGANALADLSSIAAQLAQDAIVEVDQVATYKAIVLYVEIPEGLTVELRDPISNLDTANTGNSQYSLRLCKIVYHDGTTPFLAMPRRVGQSATGQDATFIQMHREMGKVAHAADTELAIPAPGDLIEISYSDPIQKTGASYRRLLVATPNPGQIAELDLTSILDGSLPYNSLEDYGFSEDPFDTGLLEDVPDGGGSIGDGWVINDPNSEHYQLALTYAEHYDNQTYGADKYSSRNAPFFNQLHEIFLVYAKAFVAMCNREGIDVFFNSAYRSKAYQKQLYDNYQKLSAEQKAETPQPALDVSWHGMGMALDFNAVYLGTTLNSNPKKDGGSKEEWIASGVPGLIELLGLRWGGDFPNNYDPIHFDCSTLWRKDSGTLGTSDYSGMAKKIAQLAGTEVGVNGNTANIPAKS